jgi:hypothetical protein
MAHLPQHAQNPCSLDRNEQVPAKIWELLRRNERFKKAVTRLKVLDKRAPLTPENSYGEKSGNEHASTVNR